MRIETRPNGSGVNRTLREIRAKGATLLVSLNDQMLRYTLIADTDTGYVRYVVEDENGLPLADPDTGDWVIRDEYGVVKINVRYR